LQFYLALSLDGEESSTSQPEDKNPSSFAKAKKNEAAVTF